VVELNSFGGEDKQYEVKLDPAKLAAVGLGLSDVVEAMRRSNANAGGGYIERNREAILIRAEGLVTSLDDVANVGGGGEQERHAPSPWAAWGRCRSRPACAGAPPPSTARARWWWARR
jgi:hypothetical protein